MNIFVIHPDVEKSCRELASMDPRRAWKQLVECCQLLASADHILLGGTAMTKADGTSYGMAHPHHPITRNMVRSRKNRDLCIQVASCLADIHSGHACAETIRDYLKRNIDPYTENAARLIQAGTTSTLCVCRKGMARIYADTIEEYTGLLRPYLIRKIEADRAA